MPDVHAMHDDIFTMWTSYMSRTAYEGAVKSTKFTMTEESDFILRWTYTDIGRYRTL